MDFSEVLQRRTIRFFEQRPVPRELLDAMLEAAMLAPSAANRQVLRYTVAESPAVVAQLLKISKYGGYVAPRRSPETGKNGPAAFIAVHIPRRELLSNAYADAGAAIMSMLFAAWAHGLGCCWVGAFDKSDAEKVLNLNEDEAMIYLVAVGYPGEHPYLERIDAEGDIHYYLDDKDRLHVPKHRIEGIATYL